MTHPRRPVKGNVVISSPEIAELTDTALQAVPEASFVSGLAPCPGPSRRFDQPRSGFQQTTEARLVNPETIPFTSLTGQATPSVSGLHYHDKHSICIVSVHLQPQQEAVFSSGGQQLICQIGFPILAPGEEEQLSKTTRVPSLSWQPIYSST